MVRKMIIVDDLEPILDDLEYTIGTTNTLQVVAKGTSGREAVELAQRHDFDLMLIDIEMEDAHAGIRAVREIISQKPDAQIAFLTAHDTKETILAAMATGAVDYIVKGIRDEELINHIEMILKGEPELDNRVQRLLLTEYKRLTHSEEELRTVMNKIKRLTIAETEIIGLLLLGKTRQQIAELRHVELVTIKTQISSILKKFEVNKSKKIIRLINDLKLENLFY